jgi:hypothetical protein
MELELPEQRSQSELVCHHPSGWQHISSCSCNLLEVTGNSSLALFLVSVNEAELGTVKKLV